MTEDITRINEQLMKIEKDLYKASTEYRELSIDAAGKRAAYDVRYASEFLKASQDSTIKRTVPATEAFVVEVVSHDLSECRIAEAKAEAAKRHLATLQSLLSSVQTRASLLKTERSMANYAA